MPFRRGKGQNLLKFMQQLNPTVRGWANCYRYIEITDILRELYGWIRRHLRKILWRQWKRLYTQGRMLMLMRLGLEGVRIDRIQLVSLVDQHR
ncbi:group II intron maturase-specific domain-containing protein [Microbulbifer taiwanensis]|uniref:Group II intron maturase-specific domain-containing protein n=1 Tax=Microbulbifer taiwanensis TaxID=986746 RepID=A0ABW1YN11_9GAMM|nr:group II intron maturase-specific domain-containing protein [Microbulbifer taiwanensis]